MDIGADAGPGPGGLGGGYGTDKAVMSVLGDAEVGTEKLVENFGV